MGEHEGMLDATEAAGLVTETEIAMQKLNWVSTGSAVDDNDVMEQLPWLAMLDADSRAQVIEGAGSVKVKEENEVLMNLGDASDSLCVIVGGIVEVKIRNASGLEIVVATLRRGQVIG